MEWAHSQDLTLSRFTVCITIGLSDERPMIHGLLTTNIALTKFIMDF